MRATFAVIHTWPDLKNAEYEVLQRVLKAAQRCDAEVVVIDNNGKILWFSAGLHVRAGSQLDGRLVDFAIALHFESPRIVDAYSYVTLWQPIEFYFDFGYQKSIDKVSTHNDLLSCASDIADAHGRNVLGGVGRPTLNPLPQMFHTLPEPFLTPSTRETSRLFYIGINWERIGRPKGRFHDVLVMLEDKDLVDIYGPELVYGVAPWGGFKGYQGELPFDGESVKYAINRAGICLALSSAAHKRAGIMSNRLFEGFAGGAAVIASPNPLIDKYFKDVVYLVDDTRGERILGQQIQETVRRIRSDPAEACRRTSEGQRILREHCSLEGSIKALIAQTPQRVAHHERIFLADASVTLCLIVRTTSFTRATAQLRQLAAQKRSSIRVHLICDTTVTPVNVDDIAAMATGSITSIEVCEVSLFPSPDVFDGLSSYPERTGPAVRKILARIETPYFAFMHDEDSLFSEHFASLAKALERDPKALVASSGMIIESEDLLNQSTRVLDSTRFHQFTSILLLNETGQAGRFLFRARLIDDAREDLINLLDGEEHAYFRLSAYLSGPLAQTGYASYILDETARGTTHRAEPVEHQRQYIRDAFAVDPRWLGRLAETGIVPNFVYAYAPGAPINWSQQAAPPQMTRRIPFNTPLKTANGGIGIPYLVSGFSNPEDEFTWIAADRGVIEFAVEPHTSPAEVSYSIVLRLAGRPSLTTGRDQHCTFALNGKVIAYQRVPEAETDIQLAVPVQRMGLPTEFRLELVPDHADQVYNSLGEVIDERRLSVCVGSIEIRRDDGDSLPILRPDMLYACNIESTDAGVRALFSGFYYPEMAFTWIAGTEGTMRFGLTTAPRKPFLRLVVHGRRALESGSLPTVGIVLNGSDLGAHELRDGVTTLDLDLGDADVGGRLVWLTLKPSAAEAVYDADHGIIDSRLLGLAVHAFGMFDRVSESGNDKSEKDQLRREGRQVEQT